jgi:hypothetical protein
MSGYSPCLPIVADLDCGEIGHPVRVTGSDPYRLDADDDGIGWRHLRTEPGHTVAWLRPVWRPPTSAGSWTSRSPKRCWPGLSTCSSTPFDRTSTDPPVTVSSSLPPRHRRQTGAPGAPRGQTPSSGLRPLRP